MPWACGGFDDIGKLGRGFSSLDDLDKVDIGDRIVHRPLYVSSHLNPDQKQKIYELLKGYMCCFAWDYTEMPGLRRELVEHRLPLKLILDHTNREPGTSSQRSSEG
jgi:hypothetical protein